MHSLDRKDENVNEWLIDYSGYCRLKYCSVQQCEIDNIRDHILIGIFSLTD